MKMRVDCNPVPTPPPKTHLLADGAVVPNHPLRFLPAVSVLDKYFFFYWCVYVFFLLSPGLSECVCARGRLLGLIWSVALGIKGEVGDGEAAQQHAEHRAPSRDPAGV